MVAGCALCLELIAPAVFLAQSSSVGCYHGNAICGRDNAPRRIGGQSNSGRVVGNILFAGAEAHTEHVSVNEDSCYTPYYSRG